MTKRTSAITRLLGLALGLGAAMSVQAANTWYTLTDNSSGNPTTAGVSISGYYAKNNASGVLDGSSTWTSTPVGYSSGLGLTISSDGNTNPNHAVDNKGNTEAILLKFDSAVALSAIDLGWLGCADGTQTSGCKTDADITIYRYNGTDPTPMTNTATPAVAITASQSGMTANGWTLVGNYADLTLDKNTVAPFNTVNGAANNSGTLTDGTSYSSWWLISAFNSGLSSVAAVAGNGTDKVTGLNNGNDYFKLYSVAAATCTGTVTSSGSCKPPSTSTKVPEPASLALAGVALLGVFGLRRRHKAGLAG